MEPKAFIWSIAFKKRHSGKLKWINVHTQNSHEAKQKATEFIHSEYPNQGYNYYGSSKTFLYSGKMIAGTKYFCEDGDKLFTL